MEKRKVIKTLANVDREFIPDGYEEFDANAADIYERPLIFVGKRMTRDQYFEFQECIKTDFPKGMDVEKMSKEERQKHAIVHGKKDAYRYVWDTCISKLKNVIIEVDGEIITMDECEDKDLIWKGAGGLQTEITEAITFFITESSFSGAESKNSD